MFYKKPLYQSTDKVCAKENPEQELRIRIYAYNIYYCTIKNNPEAKELIYFENELTPYPVLKSK
ncbi:hypothetical protein [Zunongwangia profunda]|uniref:Uncharacterized protein n=1 Tax=Zunongwangia profunda (strain DSM 18752 / CCTCC AB 206139 / SM-A87) TaxID=655815 RepID=D5BKF2_ZUNPS|nr:hypothetical protein [Zunongwangia profunda]ADF51832.1 hypothetical protein ZPR_1497 [Zunongwangia profunda SM-A87]MAG89046.1 hypothetical protein [Flavobacteriaceae bacterium]MCC4227662.1 hypothetical protein [Zunongwangia profunda]|tara:strand:- start:2156 stop:2347 length:192 start_codon:yes stop_codon:yes gene_type:complete